MSEALQRMTEAHLQELIDEVWAGRCVAFVGAGFSAAANLPGWESLLTAAAESLPRTHRHWSTIQSTLSKPVPSNRELEATAQLLQDAVGPLVFREAVSKALVVTEPLGEQYLERRRLLKQVPFRGILTTNFDALLPGHLPSSSGYRALLRDDPGGPWSSCYWPGGDGPAVMQMHGSIGTERLVFARRDYRDLVFGAPGYLTFLRSLFATKTVLFLGFSFRDAYIDLLRSELMSLVDKPGDDSEPTAFGYSIMTDVSEAEVEYYRAHEGLRVLWFERTPDFSGMDRLLLRLAEGTNPLLRLRKRLEGARVLWLDPVPDNNEFGREIFGDGSTTIRLARSIDDAVAELESAPFDLVITHWGHQRAGLSIAQGLLDRRAGCRHRAPVIVFCDPEFAAENRRDALQWGAFELTSTWTELFRAVDAVLREG